MVERVTGWSSRRPWRVLGAWAVALIAAAAINAVFLGDALSGDEDVTSATESNRAYELEDQRFAEDSGGRVRDPTEVIVVSSATTTVDDPRFERRVEGLAASVRHAGAAAVTTFYDAEAERLVSRERDATGLLVSLGGDAEDVIEGIVEVVQDADGEDGFRTAITGEFTLDADFSTLAEEDLAEGELGFGLPVALVVLLFVFGSVVAGLVPLLLALISIAVALALVALVGQAFPLSVFATNMLTGMGLALGIDYTLFVLSRFREERGRGRERLDAIAIVGVTASRAVLFSGVAFTLAMVGLLLVPSTIMRSLAAGAIAAGLVSVVAALTLLPAVLSLIGDRVNALRLPFFGRMASREQSPFWSRAVGAVASRPVISFTLATAILLAMALPVLSLRSGEAGVSTLPDRLAAKQGYDALNATFPGETTDPVEIMIDGDESLPGVQAGIERLREELAREELFGTPQVETNAAGDLTIVSVPVQGDALGAPAVDAVRELRSDFVPEAFAGSGAEVLVAGDTA
ncbi:MAG TPA: MMPL family transporter [Solirubrobacterales bacterium]|nr:MMPL family transporter [Solirubrobacterales bacterium]